MMEAADVARLLSLVWLTGLIGTCVAAYIVEKRTEDDELVGCMVVLSVVWPVLYAYLIIRSIIKKDN
jgi:uncharacterized membrane protein YsdA (DUF1294 family)